VVQDTNYVHGCEPDEQRRLSLLNELLNRTCLEAVAVRPGERVLDVGSGLGQFACAMAAAGAVVTGVERDARQLAAATAALAARAGLRVTFRRGDATALPLLPDEAGAFDVAHARFLLEHVPDPLAVVRQMVRAVRPGGRIVLVDDDHELLRLWPPAEALELRWRAYWRCYERLGNDAFVGRKLVALLHGAGARPERAVQLPFGACQGQDVFQPLIDNLLGVMASADAAVLQAGLLGERELAAARAEAATWRMRPDATLWYVVNVARGVRPAA
jgi:SAM-dependent methyltransferase